MRKIWVVFATAVAMTACDTARAELEQKVVELQTVSAQKDSLMQEVMSTTQFVSDLSTDLAAVKALNAGKPVAAEASELEGKSPAQLRAQVRERVRDLAERFQQTESRLAQSRARVSNLTSSNADMQKQLAVYDSTINSLRAVMESQKTEISSLSEQVQGLQQANVTLAAARDTLTMQRDQLTSTVSAMTTESNKAYYIVGTESDLVKRGIIQKRGGFLGIGRTVAPARSLSEADFTVIDRMRDSSISFPKADKRYQIVTRQDTRFLAVQPDKDGALREGLRVASPEQFWASSKFLILIER